MSAPAQGGKSAKATSESSESTTESTGGQKVVYTGGAGTREITAAQWKGAGVEGQSKTVWNIENDYSLPIGDFSAEALEVLKRDPQIKVK